MWLVRYLPLLAQYAVLIDGLSFRSFGFSNTVSGQDNDNLNFANNCAGRMEDAGLGCACSQIGRRCNDPLSICDQSHHCICDGRQGFKAPDGTVCLPYTTATTTTCPVCPTTAPVTCPTATTTTTTASTAPTTPVCVVTNPVPPPSTCPNNDVVPQTTSPAGPCPVSSAVAPACVKVTTGCPNGFESTTVVPGVPVVFISPSYPEDYGEKVLCVSLFTAPACYTLKVAVLEYDVEGFDDPDDPGCYDKTLNFGSATPILNCNDICPPTDLSIPTSRMGIAFGSDGSSGGHFKFLFTAVQTAACCA